MTALDIRITALEEAASLAEDLAHAFSQYREASYAVSAVARLIRAQVTLEIEEADAVGRVKERVH